MRMRVRRGQGGFTLLEIMVAVAIVAGLATAVAPNVMQQIERSKVARAMSDVKTIANAVNAFHNDVGRLPERYTSYSYDDGNLQNVGPAQDAAYLDDVTAQTRSGYSSGGHPRCYVDSPWTGSVCWNYHLGFSQWLTANGGVGYDASKWRGPYLQKNPLDPWGKRYYVLLIGNGPARNWGCGNTWSFNSVVVLSAGPNGVIETPSHIWYSGYWEPKTYGDDVIYVAQNLRDRRMLHCDTNSGF